MKKFTKAIAAFCAMAMVFGTFSATVFADEVENGQDQAVAEEVAEPAQQDDQSDEKSQKKADKAAEKEAKAEEKAEKKAEKAEEKAQKEADKETKQEEKAAEDQDVTEGKVDEPAVAEDAAAADDAAVEGADEAKPDEAVEEEPVAAKKAPTTRSSVIDIDADCANLPTTSGSYRLTNDITVTGTASVETAGVNIILDLNGHTITYTGSGSLYVLGHNETVSGKIHVYGDVNLTIKDSGSDGIIVASGGANVGSTDKWVSITTKNGEAKIGTNENRGGCILIECGCTFTFEGGTISGFHAGDEGGAVHTSNGGTFIMKGGCITGCTAASHGGGVTVHGASNGTTTNTSVYYHSDAESEPEFKPVSIVANGYIEGGVIEGNTTTGGSSEGGGIRVLRGNLEISGGTITGNSAKGSGGGVAINKGTVYTPVYKISGNPVIKNNSCSDSKKRNLYFVNDASFSFDGNLSSEAEIYFNAANPRRDIFNINGKSYSLDSFKSDDKDYAAVVSNGKIRLTNVVPLIEGYRLVVGGEILLETVISLGNVDKSDVSATFSYSYTKGSTKHSAGYNVSSEEIVADSGNFYKFTIPVESACMTSPITVKLFYTDSNNESRTFTGKAVTIHEYAEKIKNGSYPQATKDLVKALIDFGGYAQVQLDINNTSKMLPTLYKTDYTSTPSSALVGAEYTLSDPDGAYGGATVSLLSQNVVKLRFRKSKIEGDAPQLKVTYASGSTVYLSYDETLSTGSSYYVYLIKGADNAGFKYSQYDVSFDFEIGTVQGTYSIYDYLKAVKATSSNQAMVNLVNAYYNFADKAKNYTA